MLLQVANRTYQSVNLISLLFIHFAEELTSDLLSSNQWLYKISPTFCVKHLEGNENNKNT